MGSYPKPYESNPHSQLLYLRFILIHSPQLHTEVIHVFSSFMSFRDIKLSTQRLHLLHALHAQALSSALTDHTMNSTLQGETDVTPLLNMRHTPASCYYTLLHSSVL